MSVISEIADIGKHGWAGELQPNEHGIGCSETFSVGCFEWVQAKGGGVKRGKVKVRVRGRCSNATWVYARASEICRRLDEGTYEGPKTVMVR